jgi:adenylate kinase
MHRGQVWLRLAGVAFSQQSEAAAMRKFIIMGVQGSGKGTQARMLTEDLDLEHISVGDILRWNIQNHTKLGARVKRIMDRGDLVGDDLVDDVVRRRLDEHDWNYGFVLDGFPRSVKQAGFFLESYDIDAVILIEVPDAVARERMLSRRLCSRCGVDYNLMDHRPATEDTCDMCQGSLVVRADDTPEAIGARLAEYHAKTRPILELFGRKELVITADGTRCPADVQQEIRTRLHLPARRAAA